MSKVFIAAGPAPRRAGVRIALFALSAWAGTAIVAAAQQAPGQAEDAAAAAKAAEAADEAPRPVVDPSASHKTDSLILLKDPNVEPLLDPKKFPPIRAQRAATAQEIAQLKQMAPNPLAQVDVNVITNVVNSMVDEMTNTRNLQAIRDAASEKNTATLQAVQVATQNLLEPVFTSRSAKNVQFQTKYNQVLLQKLTPVLKHHLIARIQAMIILAQSANPEALPIFLDEIKNPTQTVWVKLWAFRGITNIKLYANRLNTAQEANAAKVISDQLLKGGKEWPAWVQIRALEALGALRQAFLPTSPRSADMAAAAFQYLMDESLPLEVRSRAALALGNMQITTAIPKFNFELVAYVTAQVGAELAGRVADGFSENYLRAQDETATIVGPVFQAFEGQAGLRDSGLLNNPTVANKADVQKYFDALKPVAMSAAALSTAPSGQVAGLTAELKQKVDAYKAFLAKTPPADGTLFPGGPTFTPKAPAAGPQAAAEARR